MNQRLRAWEVAGLCVAVAIGAAVGVTLMLKDAINAMLDADVEWPTFDRTVLR